MYVCRYIFISIKQMTSFLSKMLLDDVVYMSEVVRLKEFQMVWIFLGLDSIPESGTLSKIHTDLFNYISLINYSRGYLL